MRLIVAVLALGTASLCAQSSDEKDAVATVQKTFDGMAAHNADAIRSTLLADARIYFVRDTGAPASISGDEFVTRISSAKGEIVERFIGQPAVSIRGRMAQVWGEYEFLRNGKFSHCGVDSVSLLKADGGWKIAAIVYTAETTGCKGR